MDINLLILIQVVLLAVLLASGIIYILRRRSVSSERAWRESGKADLFGNILGYVLLLLGSLFFIGPSIWFFTGAPGSGEASWPIGFILYFTLGIALLAGGFHLVRGK